MELQRHSRCVDSVAPLSELLQQAQHLRGAPLARQRPQTVGHHRRVHSKAPQPVKASRFVSAGCHRQTLSTDELLLLLILDSSQFRQVDTAPVTAVQGRAPDCEPASQHMLGTTGDVLAEESHEHALRHGRRERMGVEKDLSCRRNAAQQPSVPIHAGHWGHDKQVSRCR